MVKVQRISKPFLTGCNARNSLNQTRENCTRPMQWRATRKLTNHVNKHDCDSRVTSCEKWRAEFSSRQQCARRPLGGSKALAHTQSLASSPLCPALFGALGAHGSALGRQLSGARRRADCRPLRGSHAHASPVSPDVRRFLRPFKTRLRTRFCPPRM